MKFPSLNKRHSFILFVCFPWLFYFSSVGHRACHSLVLFSIHPSVRLFASLFVCLFVWLFCFSSVGRRACRPAQLQPGFLPVRPFVFVGQGLRSRAHQVVLFPGVCFEFRTFVWENSAVANRLSKGYSIFPNCILVCCKIGVFMVRPKFSKLFRCSKSDFKWDRRACVTCHNNEKASSRETREAETGNVMLAVVAHVRDFSVKHDNACALIPIPK